MNKTNNKDKLYRNNKNSIKLNDSKRKSINIKRQRTIQKNAPTKYESYIKKHCERFNMDWLNAEFSYLLTNVNKHDFTYDFSISQKQIPELKEVLKLIFFNGMYTRSDFIKRKMDISLPTAQKYLLRLCKLRWCIRGRGVKFTDINPFLQFLVYTSYKNTSRLVQSFAPKQVDLLDIFTYPLFEALKEKVNDVSFIWSQHEPNFNQTYFPKVGYHPRLYPYFNGIVQIKVETDNENYFVTLPYNIHWDGTKKHITLPIPFKFFGIEECGYSNNGLKVHFDNSITVAITLGSASWQTREEFNAGGVRHWSDIAKDFMHKYWKNEYVESSSFENHEKIIRNRLFYRDIPIKEFKEKDLILKQFLAEF